MTNEIPQVIIMDFPLVAQIIGDNGGECPEDLIDQLDELKTDIATQESVDQFNDMNAHQCVKVQASYDADTNEITFDRKEKGCDSFTVSRDEGLDLIAGGAHIDYKFVDKAGSAQEKFEDGKYSEEKYADKIDYAKERSDERGDSKADCALYEFDKANADGEVAAEYDEDGNQFTFVAVDSGVTHTVSRVEGLHLLALDESGEAPITAASIIEAVATKFLAQFPFSLAGPDAWANPPGEDNPVESLVFADYNTDENHCWNVRELSEALTEGAVVITGNKIQLAEGIAEEYQPLVNDPVKQLEESGIPQLLSGVMSRVR